MNKIDTYGNPIDEESSVCVHSMTINNPEPPNAPLDPDDDKVNNPSHYQSYIKDGIDCITAMQHAFGIEATATFCKLNAFKYNWRASSKNGNEDIQKAVWYLNKYLELGGENL